MLLLFIILFFLITLFTGIWAQRLVKNTGDFILAGQKLPLYMATTTVFATWFGSETVVGASSRFSEKGLQGVIEDPFGASLCLILVGLFFARPLYKMKLLTFGDFYKVRYGKKAELIASVILVISYLGWIAAQMVALGIVLNIVCGLEVHIGIILSSLIVIIYTYWGGMWAVSITDFIQTILIVIGIIIASVYIIHEAGGLTPIIEQTPEHFFRFFPNNNTHSWLEWIAAWCTLGLGSIPQQDVYQRVMASKSEKVAVRSSYIGAVMYLSIALLPLLLVLAAKILLPDEPDSQVLLPKLILLKTPLWVQILFFGALLSAIMSTASGALLAPAVILSENILKPRMKTTNDKQLLRLSRISILIVAGISLLMALVRKDIYELVGEASAISLVSLFIPLCFGLYTKNQNEKACIISMLAGMSVWFITKWLETNIPPILLGTFVSLVTMLVISIKKTKK